MARATYMHVAKLASLSGIDTGFLGGEASSHPGVREYGKHPIRAIKLTAAQSPSANRTPRVRIPRPGEIVNPAKHASSGNTRMSWQEVPDRHTFGDETGRIEVQKGGAQQTYTMDSNGVASSRGDHNGRKKTLRTKGQEESREHQP